MGIVVRQRRLDFLGGRDDAFDVALQNIAEAVERLDVQRIADGHGQRGVVLVNGDDLVAAGDFAGHKVEDFLRDLQAGQGNDLHAELAGKSLQDIGLRDDAAARKNVNDALVLLARVFPGLNGLLPRDQPDALENFQNIFVVRRQNLSLGQGDVYTTESNYTPVVGVSTQGGGGLERC